MSLADASLLSVNFIIKRLVDVLLFYWTLTPLRCVSVCVRRYDKALVKALCLKTSDRASNPDHNFVPVVFVKVVVPQHRFPD